MRMRNKESGSVTVLTLLGIGVILGAFLYVAVIGSRATEKVRVQVAADATALGAATIKARTLNYAAFDFMALSVMLPLSQVAWFITASQIAAKIPAVCAVFILVGDELEALNCALNLGQTAVTSKLKAMEIEESLNALSDTAEALNDIGPVWAELVAVQTGTAAAYQTKTGAVDVAASYPMPQGANCTGLGMEMVGNMESIAPENQSACKVDSQWELIYAVMGLDVIYSPLALWSWLQTDPVSACQWLGPPVSAVCATLVAEPSYITIPVLVALAAEPIPSPIQYFAKTALSNMALITTDLAEQGTDSLADYLATGELPCHFEQKVPALSSTWQQRQRSLGLAMISQPSESHMLARLRSLQQGSAAPPKSLGPSGLLGIACAEHYAQDHVGTESLWHMDWRARLVPCQFQSGSDRQLVEQCSVAGDPMVQRFTYQMSIGMAQDFSH